MNSGRDLDAVELLRGALDLAHRSCRARTSRRSCRRSRRNVVGAWGSGSGSKLPSRSRGSFRRTLPSSVSTGLRRSMPLRWLASLASASFARCTSIAGVEHALGRAPASGLRSAPGVQPALRITACLQLPSSSPESLVVLGRTSASPWPGPVCWRFTQKSSPRSLDRPPIVDRATGSAPARRQAQARRCGRHWRRQPLAFARPGLSCRRTCNSSATRPPQRRPCADKPAPARSEPPRSRTP